MILTCPDCATSYFVDDARIPAAGRTVKCTSCGARWLASKEAAEFAAVPEEAEAAEPAPAAAQEPAAPAETPPPEPDVPFVPIVEAARPRAKRSGRRRLLALGAAAVVLLALAATAVLLLRGTVTGLPSVAGRSAGGHGLTIAAVKAQAIFVGGRPALSVTGEIRNGGREPLDAPPLTIHLVDEAGETVAEKTAQPEGGKVPAGATRYFAVAFVDPPKGSHDLEVTFAPAAKAGHATTKGEHAAPAAPAPPAAEAHHGPEPEEAKPLPPGSPDSLDHHG